MRRTLMFGAYRDLPASVWVLALGTLVNRAGAMLLPFLTLYLTDEMGWSLGFAAGTLAAYGAGSLTAALVGGYLADVIGRKRVMVISMTGGALLIAAWSVVDGRGGVIVLATTMGLVLEMYRPSSSALLAELVTPAQRPRAFGLIYVAINLGFAIAPVVGGWLAERSYRLVFWGDALTSLAFAGIIAAFVREPGGTASSAFGADGEPRPATAAASLREGFRIVSRDRAFLGFSLGTLLIASMYVQSSATLPLYLTDVGYTPFEIGRLLGLNGLLIVILQLPLSGVVGRWPRGPALALGALLVGAGFAMHGAGTSVTSIAMAISVWTLGEMIVAPVSNTLVSEMAPDGMRARYLGMFTFAYTGAVLVGAPLGGGVLARWGAGALWLGCLFVGISCATLFLVIRVGLTGDLVRRGAPALVTPVRRDGGDERPA